MNNSTFEDLLKRTTLSEHHYITTLWDIVNSRTQLNFTPIPHTPAEFNYSVPCYLQKKAKLLQKEFYKDLCACVGFVVFIVAGCMWVI